MSDAPRQFAAHCLFSGRAAPGPGGAADRCRWVWRHWYRRGRRTACRPNRLRRRQPYPARRDEREARSTSAVLPIRVCHRHVHGACGVLRRRDDDARRARRADDGPGGVPEEDNRPRLEPRAGDRHLRIADDRNRERGEVGHLRGRRDARPAERDGVRAARRIIRDGQRAGARAEHRRRENAPRSCN